MRRDLSPLTHRHAPQTFTGHDPFAALQNEMNRIFDDVWRGFNLPTNDRGFGMVAPSIDVSEDDEAIYVTAELPGLTEKDVDVTYADGVLRIAGEKQESREDRERNYYVTERSWGRFHRELPIGREIREDQVDAAFKNGVLTVTLPKAAEGRNARKIEVKRAA